MFVMNKPAGVKAFVNVGKLICFFIVLSCLPSCQNNKEMKELKVKKINAAGIQAVDVPALLDKENVSFQPIDQVNWPKEYPYKPEVKFRIAYTGNAILLNYRVKEASVRAKYAGYNEAVWTDSCVEFFIIPGEDNTYYNVETNCIGTILVGAGAGRDNREHAPANVLDKVSRWSSLGSEPFDERIGETEWELALVLPYEVFFKNNVTSLDGKTVRANFYKCGDELETPHFLSWNKIDVPSPNFHLPEFFGTLTFE